MRHFTSAALLLCTTFALAQSPSGPVIVKFHEPRQAIAEVALSVDPTPKLQYQFTGQMGLGLTVEGKLLCCGAGAIRTLFRIDGQTVHPGTANQANPLAVGPNNKKRHGIEAKFIHNGIHFTQSVEIVPSRVQGPQLAGQKRRLDTALIRYTIENKDTRPHTVGARVRIDGYCVDNDGALCASPKTHPGEILNGIELKGKNFPEFVQVLQRPDLKNPGFVAHFTLKFGNRLEGPDRFVVTTHGAPDNGWDITVMRSNGDSDWGLFWEPKVIPAGGKRELAYAYGQGIASDPENEGRITLRLAGSFEPTKTFTIQAHVDDPAPSQTITLELPEGLKLLEGRETQPVPAPPPGSGSSLVLWKASVQRLGDFPIRIHSTNGVSQTRTVTISRRIP